MRYMDESISSDTRTHTHTHTPGMHNVIEMVKKYHSLWSKEEASQAQSVLETDCSVVVMMIIGIVIIIIVKTQLHCWFDGVGFL